MPRFLRGFRKIVFLSSEFLLKCYKFVGYVPKTIKKGEDEYMIVVEGVKDTGNSLLFDLEYHT